MTLFVGYFVESDMAVGKRCNRVRKGVEAFTAHQY